MWQWDFSAFSGLLSMFFYRLFVCQRNGQDEFCTLAELAFYINRDVMLLSNPAGNREAEACTADTACFVREVSTR